MVQLNLIIPYHLKRKSSRNFFNKQTALKLQSLNNFVSPEGTDLISKRRGKYVFSFLFM